MPISRCVLRLTLGCATFASVALLASHAGASPTADYGHGADYGKSASDQAEAGKGE